MPPIHAIHVTIPKSGMNFRSFKYETPIVSDWEKI